MSGSVSGLMVICAHRTLPESIQQELTLIRQGGAVPVDSISLQPLSHADIVAFLESSLKAERSCASDLGHILHRKTLGNPYDDRQMPFSST